MNWPEILKFISRMWMGGGRRIGKARALYPASSMQVKSYLNKWICAVSF